MVSSREVMAAHLAQIERVNRPSTPSSPNFPTRRASPSPTRRMRARRRAPARALHGLPIAFRACRTPAGWCARAVAYLAGHVSHRRGARRTAGTQGARHRQDNVPEFGLGSHLQRGLRRHRNPLGKSAAVERRHRRRPATGCCPLPMAATSTARCATPPTSTTSSRCAPSVGLVPTARPVSAPRLRRQRADGTLGHRRGLSPRRDGGPRPADPNASDRFRRVRRRSLATCARVARAPDLGGLPLDARVRTVTHAQRATFGRSAASSRTSSGPDRRRRHLLTIRRWRTAAV